MKSGFKDPAKHRQNNLASDLLESLGNIFLNVYFQRNCKVDVPFQRMKNRTPYEESPNDPLADRRTWLSFLPLIIVLVLLRNLKIKAIRMSSKYVMNLGDFYNQYFIREYTSTYTVTRKWSH